MPQLPPYIPARNANLIAWAANFSTLITASPGTYGLLAGDATAIAAQNTARSRRVHADHVRVNENGGNGEARSTPRR